ADRNRSHWSTSKTPSYTKSVSWQHHLMAVRMRLRPILMTSLAFILGVLPLAISNGAGSGAQNAVGIGVMGGMVSATLLAIFFVPVFFVVIRRCFKG
ncbi:efflux RND transporter permease subunit, partial [Escherichia coli]|uniref:efflux RND transporter permease subunit n=1 Tax=Escherichia coli TaxID=562 RepID=UPI001FCE3DF3